MASRIGLLIMFFIAAGVGAALAQRGRTSKPAMRGTAQPPSAAMTKGDVVYGHRSGQDLLLDVYLAKSKTPTPAMIYIHGGGWNGGSKRDGVADLLVKHLFPYGISIIAVEYRFSAIEPHPAQVDDCTRALQFVRSKAKEWNIDPKRIGVTGGSAGGHLALLLGMRGERADSKSADPVERESSRVSCVVNCAGPSNFRLLREIQHELQKVYVLEMGFPPETDPKTIPDEKMDEVSPLTHVTAQAPPVLAYMGDNDMIVPLRHGEEFDARLREAGVESKLVVLPGVAHGASRAPGLDFSAGVEFIARHLKAGKVPASRAAR